MAATMWRMNGLWRRMAGVLVLCALLLSNEVMCDDMDAPSVTDQPAPTVDNSAVTAAAASAAAPEASAAPDTGATATAAAASGDSAASGAPGDSAATTVPISVDEILDAGTSVTLGPAAPTIKEVEVKPVVPGVTCVGKDDIPESNAVKVEVATGDCEATKRVIEANPAAWCAKDSCDLKIFQEGNNMLVTSDDAKLGALAGVLQGETLKDKLGVTKVDTPSSSGSSVFVGILVTGLLAAIAITVGYLKCQRRPETKGVRLAEEAYPADQENQGNTLVSVAPLNPPPETPEKPSANGESPEADKTQPPPPPTNGTSTTKTADTEL